MMYDERHRPQVHFTPAENWMNDPNGLVYHDGDYHLFYQYNPLGNTWGHMSWGHAVSRDLVHRKHLPVAIPEHDTSMIFFGSAVVDAGNCAGSRDADAGFLVAVYTAHTLHQECGRTTQTQNLATSIDGGRSWHRHDGNLILDIGSSSFRNPQVFWHEPTGRQVMVVALSNERRVRFLASQTLIRWDALRDFGLIGGVDGIWECPLLIDLQVSGSTNT